VNASNSKPILSFKNLTTQVREAPARISLFKASSFDTFALLVFPASQYLSTPVQNTCTHTPFQLPCFANYFYFLPLTRSPFACPAVWIFAVPPQHYRTTENAEHTPKRQTPRPQVQTFQSSTFFSVTQCEGCESFVNTVVRENCFV
jgi:hypothetical protein